MTLHGWLNTLIYHAAKRPLARANVAERPLLSKRLNGYNGHRIYSAIQAVAPNSNTGLRHPDDLK
jgi:hypothetical protein